VGASVGLLNVIWAATAVLGPLGAGVAAAHLGAAAAFGLDRGRVAPPRLAVTAALTLRVPPPRRGPCQVRHPDSAERSNTVSVCRPS